MKSKDWKEELYKFLYKDGEIFEVNAIQEQRLVYFISTLLEEARKEGYKEALDTMNEYQVDNLLKEKK